MIESINLNTWGSAARADKGKLRRRYARCCTDVTVLLNSRRRKVYGHYYSNDTYRRAFEHFAELGVRVHVMSWVRPDLDWINDMAEQLAELRAVAPFESLLLDAEGAWSRGFPGRRPRKRADREKAWDDAGSLTRALLTVHGIPYGVTDVPMVDWRVIKPLVLGSRYVMPQCHEFGLRGGIRKPGRLVAWTHRRWPKRLPMGCRMIPHLAMYGRTQTGDGLRRSIEACEALGYRSIGGWTGRKFAGRGLRRVLAEYKQRITDREGKAWNQSQS